MTILGWLPLPYISPTLDLRLSTRRDCMPNFSCEFTEAPTPLDHFWEHTLGSGHAPLALRADWQQQILKCHREIGVKHVRFHAILSDEMETLICQNNEFLYSFFNTDQIWDYLLSIGVCPFVEL